jgi:aminoglycoside/choline kinase family phosphotransferase
LAHETVPVEAAPLPSTPDDLSAEWLTGALRDAGVAPSCVVRSRETEPLGDGRGFTGQVARVRLQYEPGSSSAPSSLVAKLSPSEAQAGGAFESFAIEIRFYQVLAARSSIRVPRMYAGRADRAQGRTVLLLEDLAGLTSGDDLRGASPGQTRAALGELARFHAQWWGSPTLDQLGWVPTFERHADDLAREFPSLLNDCAAQYPEVLDDDAIALGRRYGRGLANVQRLLSRPPRTIAHGDFRLDNLFFDARSPESPVTVIDWQGILRGRGAFDLAHFIAIGRSVEERRSAENDLLLEYHAALVGAGVNGYSLSECRDDYRLGLFRTFLYLVIAGALFDARTDRGRELVSTLLERVVAALDDSNAVDLLPRAGWRPSLSLARFSDRVRFRRR